MAVVFKDDQHPVGAALHSEEGLMGRGIVVPVFSSSGSLPASALFSSLRALNIRIFLFMPNENSFAAPAFLERWRAVGRQVLLGLLLPGRGSGWALGMINTFGQWLTRLTQTTKRMQPSGSIRLRPSYWEAKQQRSSLSWMVC